MEDNHIFKELLINEQIIADQVRLVGVEGEQLGICSLSDALLKAENMKLDLVMIAPTSSPKVCKIMNYGKYKYETQKKEKEARKNQKVSELKEVQLSRTIDTHDMLTKAKHANRFLLDGDKVKVVLRLKGRQRAFIDSCLEVVKTFFGMIEENGVIDKETEVLGKNIIMIVKPKK
ncbi:MAG: translation initiation factor IF-3 [Clostridia bacterium]